MSDRTGQPYQHFYYAPFGDPMVSQHVGTGSFNSPFRFNAKEFDEETGNYYYGARYYEPKSSVWMGVDALATSYPGMNPYNFVMGNPIMAIDPDGNDTTWAQNEEGEFVMIDYNVNPIKTWIYNNGFTYKYHTGTRESWSYDPSMVEGYNYNSPKNTSQLSGFELYCKAIKTFNPVFPQPDPLIEGSQKYADNVYNAWSAVGIILGTTELLAAGKALSYIHAMEVGGITFGVDGFLKNDVGQTPIQSMLIDKYGDERGNQIFNTLNLSFTLFSKTAQYEGLANATPETVNKVFLEWMYVNKELIDGMIQANDH